MTEASTKKKRKVFDKRFEILSVIGRGAGSVVYHARHIDESQEEVALKVILKTPKENSPSALLRKEALALVSSRHKYVIRLDDFHALGELCYLTMELAKKGDLRQYLTTKRGKLSPVQTELFLLQAAEALDFIHKAGILHRDIKPENLLVVDDQNIRVADFGIAMLPGEKSSFEELQAGVGTLDYLSPEVLEGKSFDKRADLYALGISFYELLSGKHPFAEGPLAEQLEIRRDGGFTPIAELEPEAPAHLLSAITRLLRFTPEDRFQSATELIQALVSFDVSGLDQSTTQHVAPKQTIGPEVSEPSSRTQPNTQPEQAPKASSHTPEVIAKGEDSSETELHDSPALSYQEEVSQHSAISRSEDTTANTGDKLLSRLSERTEASPPQTRTIQPLPMPITEETRSQAPAQSYSAKAADYLNKDYDSDDSAEVANHEVPQPTISPLSQTEEISKTAGGSSLTARAYFQNTGAEATTSAVEPTQVKKNKAHFSSPKKTKSSRRSRRSRKRLLVFLVVIIGLLCGIALFAGGHFKSIMNFNSSGTSSIDAPTETDVQNSQPNLLQGVDEPLISFPNIPSGLYAGHLEFPASGSKTPFSIIALEGASQLIISIGVHGFHPVVVDLNHASFENNSFNLVSQGMILTISGRVENGALTGELKNEITGEQAYWRAQP
jgi:serine/threonine-protein kinase